MNGAGEGWQDSGTGTNTQVWLSDVSACVCVLAVGVHEGTTCPRKRSRGDVTAGVCACAPYPLVAGVDGVCKQPGNILSCALARLAICLSHAFACKLALK